MTEQRSTSGFTATVIQPGGTPKEQVEARIEEDRHVAGSQSAAVRLLREDLDRRLAAAERREKLHEEALATQRKQHEESLAALRKQQDETLAAYRASLQEHQAAIKDSGSALMALAGEAAAAAMAQLERAKITAELMHEVKKEPAPSAGVEIAKHAISVLGQQLEKIFSANPQLAEKAGQVMGAVVGAAHSTGGAPTMGQLAAARDSLTDEDLAGLAAAAGCSLEDLPAAAVIAAAEEKKAARDGA